MDRRGLSILAVTLAICLGCTQTFGPSDEDGVVDVPGADAVGVDVTSADSGGWDFTGPELTQTDTPPGVDTSSPDAAQPPATGPLFRVWITGGASASKNDQVRIIGGIQPDSGVPSGDGEHWLIPVFRAGPSATDS